MGNAGRIDMNNMCCCCCMCISGRFLRPGALLCGHVPVYRNSFLLMPENAPGSVNASGFFIWEEETLIQIEHVSKTFSGKYGTVHALDDVSIHVEKGDICGIIGFSGAGSPH